MTAVIPTALSTALFVSSLFSPNPQASSSPTPLTQVLPENNFVGHVVAKGESLSFIAQEYYGDESYWTTIWNDNPLIENPNEIYSDTLLRIRSEKPGKPEELKEELRKRIDTQINENFTIAPTAIPAKAGIYANTMDPRLSFRGTNLLEVSRGDDKKGKEIPNASQSQFDEVYKAAGAKFGVPWQILYGIHMTETGGRDGNIVSGYGTGAQGPMQFMPGTFRAYEVDGDGDGTADINNAVDAIYTAANFLNKHGDLMNGLRSYGGNIAGTLALARARGYSN